MCIEGKNILLTNYSIAEYAGSEINCLTLANTFAQMGAHVEVATLNYAYPIRKQFEKDQISVKNIFFDPLDYQHYDIIWAHHSIVMDYILYELNITADKIVYSSLSPFEPLEAIPIYAGDLSICLANSKETKEQLIKEGVRENLIQIFPNYVTQSMYDRGSVCTEQILKKAAIVSNHIPEEVYGAAELLKSHGIEVEFFGQGHNTILITAEILSQFDVVITIGKTVQYCMALGIPVYCYDIHGGPGWITAESLLTIAELNFSGRGFGKKNAQQIAEDIMAIQQGYADLEVLRQYIAQNSILETNIRKIFHILETEKLLDIEGIKQKYMSVQRWNRAIIQLYRYNLYREMKIVEMNEEKKQIVEENKILAQKHWDNYDKLISALEENIVLKDEKIRDLEEKLSQAITKHAGILSEKNTQLQELKVRALTELNEAKTKASLEMKQQAEEFERQLDACQSKFEAQVKSLQAEMLDYRMIIDRKNIELDQKEANTKYLLELTALKDQQIGRIHSSKGWRCIMFLYRVKNAITWRLKKLLSLFRFFKQTPAKLSESTPPVKAETVQSQNTQDKPLVTVAIPVYDRTDVLVESIESILRQTYPNIEIIAVCDGSPQETLDIIRSYEAQGKIRAFYYPDNSGNAVRGRNKAIREAHGVYFAFQDSDDVAEADRIETSIRYLEEHSADIVYGGWRALVDGSRQIDIENGQEVFSPDCDYEFLKEICVPCQSTVLTKTDALRKVGGLKTKMRYREDHELWLRMAYCGYKFKSIDKILTNLRLHKGNLELTFKEGDEKWFNLMQEEHKTIIPMKPKIAYLIPGCGVSGGIAVVCQHLNRLRERGYDVLMISESEETEIKWFPNQNVEIVTMANIPDNIDALVATGWTTAHSALNVPAKKKYYFVQSDETRFNPEGSYSYQKALETYSMDYQFITEAKWIKQWLWEKFGKNAYYVPNGLDPEIMYCTEKRPDVLYRKVRVLLEGPIDIPFKAMEDAFNAVNGLDCEVWCISSAGTPKSNWRCDKFFSTVPMEQMKYIYSQCDILLKMSRVEGFFGPPMEMMACGGTCVVGRVTGYDEYIVDGYNALTVELGDVQGAHDALERLINDPELRKTLAQNGEKTAAEWRWDSSIDTLEEIFCAIS